MDSTFLIVLIVFVALSTLAMIAQAIALLGIARAVRQAHEKLNGLMPEVTKILEITQHGLTEANNRTISILDATKAQLAKVDDLLADAAGRARVQMDRAELVLDDAMTRAHTTVATVQRGIIAPFREIYGVLIGIRTTLSVLGRANRPTVDHVTSDEEMFI